MPQGLLEAARADLRSVYDALDKELADRDLWLLARGFHAWFFDEIGHDRVAWPGPPLPAPLRRGDARSAQSA
jgi:hypothetical protein